MIPAHGSDDAFCRQVAGRTDYTVIDVAYRLAPECPFPAAHEDAEDAVNWVLSQKKTFDTSRVALSGFSAGGNIILGLASTVYPPKTFHTAIAFYPAVDWTTDVRAKKAPNPNGQPIPASVLRLFADALFQDPIDLANPRVSPLYADPERFPDKVLIVTAEGDSLAPEAEKLADKLQQRATGCAVHFRAVGCSHAWDKMAQTGPETIMKRHTYDMAVDMLREGPKGA